MLPRNLITELHAWDDLQGNDYSKMKAEKLFRSRIETASWNPPVLTFSIERHGAVVLGSSRATVQEWNVNLDTKSASCVNERSRQHFSPKPRLNVEPMAEEVVRLIVKRKKDERLKWNEDGSVRVLLSKILPDDSAYKATLSGRRKRLRKCLEEKLAGKDWHLCPGRAHNTFSKAQVAPTTNSTTSTAPSSKTHRAATTAKPKKS
jgi:hypothetical protein